MASLTYLGHASFQIKTDSKKIIYVDPFFGEYKLKADYVLITHEHFDTMTFQKLSFQITHGLLGQKTCITMANITL